MPIRESSRSATTDALASAASDAVGEGADITATHTPPLDAVASHARWSTLNAEFFQYLGEDPSRMERRTFRAITDGIPEMYRLQPWPLFAEQEQCEDLARVATVHRLSATGGHWGPTERYRRQFHTV